MDRLKDFRERVINGWPGPESAWTSLLAWMEEQEEINRQVAAFIAHLESQAAPSEPETDVDCNCSLDWYEAWVCPVHGRRSKLDSPPAPAGWARPADATCDHRPAFDLMWLTPVGEVRTRCWKCKEALAASFVPTPTPQAGS